MAAVMGAVTVVAARGEAAGAPRWVGMTVMVVARGKGSDICTPRPVVRSHVHC